MKIDFTELAQLQQRFFPIYIIMGNESLLVDETVQYIKKLLQKAEPFECHQLEFGGQAKVDEWLEHIHTQSLFCPKKLLELTVPNGKPGKTGGDLLQDYVAAIPDNITLCVRLPKLNNSEQKNKWFVALEKAGVLITISDMTPSQLPQWLQKRLQRVNLKITPEALQCLATFCTGNLLAAKQNIEKLKLLYQEKILTLEDIQFALNDAGHYDLYLLLDTVLQTNINELSKILSQLKATGTEPALLIWIFTKEIRTLAQLAQAKEKNRLSAELWQTLGVWRSRQNLLLTHLKQFSFQDYLSFIQQLAKLDKILKGAIDGNIWQEIELFLVNLSKTL